MRRLQNEHDKQAITVSVPGFEHASKFFAPLQSLHVHWLNRKPLPSFGAAAVKDRTAAPGRHPLAKAVHFCTMTTIGLIGPLHTIPPPRRANRLHYSRACLEGQERKSHCWLSLKRAPEPTGGAGWRGYSSRRWWIETSAYHLSNREKFFAEMSWIELAKSIEFVIIGVSLRAESGRDMCFLGKILTACG